MFMYTWPHIDKSFEYQDQAPMFKCSMHLKGHAYFHWICSLKKCSADANNYIR